MERILVLFAAMTAACALVLTTTGCTEDSSEEFDAERYTRAAAEMTSSGETSYSTTVVSGPEYYTGEFVWSKRVEKQSFSFYVFDPTNKTSPYGKYVSWKHYTLAMEADVVIDSATNTYYGALTSYPGPSELSFKITGVSSQSLTYQVDHVKPTGSFEVGDTSDAMYIYTNTGSIMRNGKTGTK